MPLDSTRTSGKKCKHETGEVLGRLSPMACVDGGDGVWARTPCTACGIKKGEKPRAPILSVAIPLAHGVGPCSTRPASIGGTECSYRET